jgi:putative ABC transport system permease protein
MRKISGAGKGQLFFQFILETTMIFTMASILAIALAEALMPIFNQLSGKALTFDLKDYHIWLLLLGSILGTLILSSIYPALLLSSFDPIKALKGKTMAGIGNGMARKTLVVVQFTFSVVLIVGTMVINSQLHYIKTKGIGYDKNYVLSFWMRDMSPHFDAVKAELMKQPGVLGVTRSNQNIIHFEGFSGDVNWEGKDPKQNLIIHPLMVDDDLIPFFKMRMVQGNNFSGFPADSTHFILNETALKESGIKDPIGKRFDIHKIQGTIIGIIQDFHFTSMKEKISPVLFAYIPQYADRIYVRTSPNDAKKVIAAASAVFARYNEEYPFNYAFLDDAFNNLYKSEQQEGSLFSYFSLIAIFISCLGLFGLATYTAQVRTREIGIRKVLGAGIGNIASMMSFDFLKLVLISAVIGIPIAWWGSHQWLEGFAYRTDLHWWLFGFAGLLTIVVAWLTVGWQAFRAAIANPVKSLRLE